MLITHLDTGCPRKGPDLGLITFPLRQSPRRLTAEGFLPAAHPMAASISPSFLKQNPGGIRVPHIKSRD